MKANQVGPLSETEECSGVKHALHQVGRIFPWPRVLFHARPLESWVYIRDSHQWLLVSLVMKIIHYAPARSVPQQLFTCSPSCK